MYIIEITKPDEKWLVALCQEKSNIEEYFSSLHNAIRDLAVCREIPFDRFPLIVIENTADGIDKPDYFEYSDFEGLNNKLDQCRQNRQSDDEWVYFKYYFLTEDYFQMHSASNFMQYLHHTDVSNDELDKHQITLTYELIKKYSHEYNIEGLDELYKTIISERSTENKTALAEGYTSLFWEMIYDFACGKLTETGVFYLEPMAEKIIKLTQKPCWDEYCSAVFTVFEHNAQNKQGSVPDDLQKTIRAYSEYKKHQAEEAQEIEDKITLAYQIAMEADPDKSAEYWQNAVEHVRLAIDADPLSDSWSKLLILSYIPFQASNDYTAEQLALQSELPELFTKHDPHDNGFAMNAASAFGNLRKHIEWKKMEESLFPSALYMQWLNKAAEYIPEKISRFDLLSNAEFFRNEGVRYKRIELIEKAIGFYERIIKQIDDANFEVYYTASSWQMISELQLEQGNKADADRSLQKAFDTYHRHLNLVKQNPSVYMHYSEFMESCFLHNGNVQKPALSELEQIASEVEEEGQGNYSSPIFMRMRLALYRNDEDEAIYHLTKSLVLHELCIDDKLEGLIDTYKNSRFNKLNNFLAENIAFMHEINEGYYLDTQLKWSQLKAMNRSELQEYWEERKVFLKNRERLDI